MWISKTRLIGIRGFRDTGELEFSRGINLLVGANNSGKSTILNCILKSQFDKISNISSPANPTEGRVAITVNGLTRDYIEKIGVHTPGSAFLMSDRIDIKLDANDKLERSIVFRRPADSSGTIVLVKPFPDYEPDNLIFPFLSKRKVAEFSEEVGSKHTNAISGSLVNLYAKVSQLSNAYAPGHRDYDSACREIFGYVISPNQSERGVIGGYRANGAFIPLTNMGEGVASLLGLIVYLCAARDKVFVIEEPENDIHPKALKALLRLIQKAAEHNQFFISTHSNVVVRQLGALADAKTFEVKMENDPDTDLPNSTIQLLPDDSESRHSLLVDLGYDFVDFGMWDGWLFFEESSAEEVVREVIIPLFFPNLNGRIRTFGKGGRNGLQQRFDDFNNLFSFLHLEPSYKNKAWVIIDGGQEEAVILQKIKDTYLRHGWKDSQFIQLNEHEFESYLPERFQELRLTLPIDRKERKDAKGKLAKTVVNWANENPELARRELADSACEIVELLGVINSAMDV